jgi:hypothetical protein
MVDNLIEPLALRIGSMTAGGLVALGMANEDAVTVQNAVAVVVLLGAELVARYWFRGRK